MAWRGKIMQTLVIQWFGKREILLGFDCMALYSIPHIEQMELVGTLITHTQIFLSPELLS